MYGLPYQGSKNLIARELIQQMPRREYFVDLFAGGGAMWHAAVESGKYQRFLVNEYNAMQCDFLRDCAMGLYDDCNEWVSRKQFLRDIQKSKFLQAVWSFGNIDSYFCAYVLEDWQMALFQAIEHNDFSEFQKIGFAGCNVTIDDMRLRIDWYRRKYQEYKFRDIDVIEQRIKEINEQNNEIKARFTNMLRKAQNSHGLSCKAIDEHLKNYMWRHYTAKPAGQFCFPTAENYERLREIMPTLPILENAGANMLTSQDEDYLILKRFITDRYNGWCTSVPHERLERLRNFHKQMDGAIDKTLFSAKSYEDVEIPEDALVYCDPPYINTSTNGYGEYTFDHARFYDWVRAQKALVVVSEYNMPDDFIPILRKKKSITLCGGRKKKSIESLFVHKSQIPILYQKNYGYQTKLFDYDFT